MRGVSFTEEAVDKLKKVARDTLEVLGRTPSA